LRRRLLRRGRPRGKSANRGGEKRSGGIQNKFLLPRLFLRLHPSPCGWRLARQTISADAYYDVLRIINS
jgi:hypothetical protein